MRPIQRVGLVLGPIIFVVMLLFPAPGELPDVGWRTAAVAALMAIWWMTEAIPLPATALLPLALFPVLGVLSMADAAGPFANDLIFLFMGGFMIAVAMERWGLHKRIALSIMSAVGTSPERLVLGFMLATAFLSMWISNTATTALMIAVAIPILRSFPSDEPFRKAIILGIPFACNIGGIGTPIGTPPNAIAIGILNQMGRSISFIEWMYRGIPVVVILLAVSWFVLCRLYPAGIKSITIEQREGRPMDRTSKFILVVFGVVVILWLTSKWHGIPSAIVSLVPLVVFFGLRLLEDEDLTDLGWGILFIIGGGMSLGVAMRESGLSDWIVGRIPFAGLGPLAILFAFSISAAAITNFISNSATANMLLPIVVGVTAIAPERSAVIVALACSAAMILPISTPPNAIAYGSGYVDVKDMIKGGAIITVISIVVITLFIHLFF